MPSAAPQDDSLIGCLDTFRSTVNGHPRLRNLLTGWNPSILIESVDSGEIYTLNVQDLAIESIEAGEHPRDHSLRVEGEEAVLKDVFLGRRNPAEAYMDGELSVFGSDKDQIKLDAITLVIWGM